RNVARTPPVTVAALANCTLPADQLTAAPVSTFSVLRLSVPPVRLTVAVVRRLVVPLKLTVAPGPTTSVPDPAGGVGSGPPMLAVPAVVNVAFRPETFRVPLPKAPSPTLTAAAV